MPRGNFRSPSVGAAAAQLPPTADAAAPLWMTAGARGPAPLETESRSCRAQLCWCARSNAQGRWRTGEGGEAAVAKLSSMHTKSHKQKIRLKICLLTNCDRSLKNKPFEELP